MHRRTSRANHVLLTLLGLVLLAGGAFLIARHYGVFAQLSEHDRIYSRPERRWLHAHDWVWWAVAAATAAIGLIALRWLLVQPRIDRVRRLYVDPEDRVRTSLTATALTDQIEDDLVGHPGVARARALIIGSAERPTLIMRVSTHAGGDIGGVRTFLVDTALPDVRTALDADALPAQLHVLVAGKTDDRVVE